MNLLNRIETTLIVLALALLLAMPFLYLWEKTHPMCRNPDGTTYGCPSDIPDSTALPIISPASTASK